MDLITEAKQDIPEVSVDELKGKLDRSDKLVLIDVRDGEEFSQGCIPSAIHMSRGTLEFQTTIKKSSCIVPLVLDHYWQHNP